MLVMAKPYEEEPLASAIDLGIDWSDSSDEHDETEQDRGNQSMTGESSSSREIEFSCQCGRCEKWSGQKPYEQICCHHYREIMELMAEGENQCIINHEGTFVNCLSRYSIECTIVLLKQKIKDYYNNQLRAKNPHNTYRHVAYSNFVRWVWRTTGKKKRKIIPACVVAAIRRTYPDPAHQYVGFKYAD